MSTWRDRLRPEHTNGTVADLERMIASGELLQANLSDPPGSIFFREPPGDTMFIAHVDFPGRLRDLLGAVRWAVSRARRQGKRWLRARARRNGWARVMPRYGVRVKPDGDWAIYELEVTNG